MIKAFANAYEFCDGDTTKFGLMLRKGVYLYEYKVKNFRNKCIENYELDTAHFLSAPWLAWQPCFQKTKVKLELLTDINMLSMAE